MTCFAALTRQTSLLGDRPAVVFADAATGERTELGYATLHNWVSKTANLLIDDLDAGVGTEVSLTGPAHWLVPVVALASWAVGAAVRTDTAGEVVVGHEHDGDEVDLLIGAGLGGRPVAEGGGTLTVTDVLAQPDDFVDDPGDEGAWALGGRTQASLLAEAEAGPRVLQVVDRVDDALVARIARTIPAGTCLVMARGFDDAGLRRLAEQEGV